METVLDIGAVIIFLLVVPSVAWAVRTEAKEVPAILAVFVGIFVTIFGIVFMSAASQLATSTSSTQAILLVFFVVIAIFARTAWASKPAH
jgi:predicted CDP-diglyceride synthetase/phosphatidate cytidylyltransferase